MNIMNMPITGLKGIGPKKAEQFYKKGINSVYDLISYLPSRYEDRGAVSYIENLTVGESVCIKARITAPVRVMRVRKSLTITRTTAADDSGEIILCWYNQKYIDKALKYDEIYTFYGKISKGKSGLEMVNPVVESMEKEGKYTGKIIPVYHGIMPISQKSFISAQEEALKQGESVLVSFLPEVLEKKYNLLNVYDATKNIHFPENEEMLIKARERFAFEKFFHFQTAMRMLRSKEKEKGIIFNDVNTDAFEKSLPFNLTDAQKKVVNAVKKDLVSGKASKRLVQGDVGSGKTVVAVIMAYLAVKNGYQATVMAPTEILAKQHFITFSKMLPDLNIECLTSSVTKKNKEIICEKLSRGEINVLIGTHALIEDYVVFKNLGYVICDEQHRFGVNQRVKLIEKGDNPHLAVMTATPIPRTLSLVLYGDLNPSVIDQLPPGRQKIKTYLLNEGYRVKAYGFVKEQIKNGGQAYVVCPLVEENEELDLKSATEFAKELEKDLENVRVGLLHGKMKDAEKTKVMDAFKNKEFDVLVSTTVVEVGVDVPNATVIIIENAERFGLSQLHQLRGRVGRGERQSYCFMFAKTGNMQTIERLKVIEKSSDGFYISEQDLKMRGPGDFFGSRQSGLPEIKGIFGEPDMEILEKTTEAVNLLVDKKLIITENERKLLNFIVKKEYFNEKIHKILN